MKYWFDTEFVEDGKNVDLISIGIVAEDGRELYKQNQECCFSDASDWVARNVFPSLLEFDMGMQLPTGNERDGWNPREHGGWWRQSEVWRMRDEIANDIKAFVADDPNPEFWAYYADYDWVAFCQLFGTMMDLPKGFPMYCRDIKQWCDQLGNPTLPVQGEGEHNALADARWNRQAFEFLSATAIDSFGDSLELRMLLRYRYNESGDTSPVDLLNRLLKENATLKAIVARDHPEGVREDGVFIHQNANFGAAAKGNPV